MTRLPRFAAPLALSVLMLTGGCVAPIDGGGGGRPPDVYWQDRSANTYQRGLPPGLLGDAERYCRDRYRGYRDLQRRCVDQIIAEELGQQNRGYRGGYGGGYGGYQGGYRGGYGGYYDPRPPTRVIVVPVPQQPPPQQAPAPQPAPQPAPETAPPQDQGQPVIGGAVSSEPEYTSAPQ